MSLFLVSLFCSIDLCVCFYASAMLFWLLLPHSLSSMLDNMIPATLFFLRIAVSSGASVVPNKFFEIFVLVLSNASWNLDRNSIKSTDCSGEYRHFNDVNSSYLWTQHQVLSGTSTKQNNSLNIRVTPIILPHSLWTLWWHNDCLRAG